MSDDTFLKFIDVAQSLAHLVVFIVSAVVVLFVFQQARIKKWLAEIGFLAQVIAFIILSELLARAIDGIVYDFFAFPRALVRSYDELLAGVRCFNSLVVLAVFAGGGWVLWKRATSATTIASPLTESVEKDSETTGID